MFEQPIKNFDDILYKDAVCESGGNASKQGVVEGLSYDKTIF